MVNKDIVDKNIVELNQLVRFLLNRHRQGPTLSQKINDMVDHKICKIDLQVVCK